jgi:hypothetical protein
MYLANVSASKPPYRNQSFVLWHNYTRATDGVASDAAVLWRLGGEGPRKLNRIFLPSFENVHLDVV